LLFILSKGIIGKKQLYVHIKRGYFDLMEQDKFYSIFLANQTKSFTEKMMVKYFEQEDISLHDHDCFELAYVVKGSAVQNINGVTEEVKEGAYFIIDHGSLHNYQSCKNLKLINCLFMPEVVDPVLVDCISFDELMRISMIRYYKFYMDWAPVDNIFYDEDKKVLRLLKEMMEECERKELGYQEIFRGKLMEILFVTMRKGLQKKEGFSIRSFEKSQLILDAIKYLEGNYKNKAPLRQFCDEKHYSTQYVSKQFKKETGITFLEYLQKIRIKKSCELLITKELSVNDIAFEVGYDNLKYFQEVFRKVVGMSPREYRRAAKMNE